MTGGDRIKIAMGTGTQWGICDFYGEKLYRTVVSKCLDPCGKLFKMKKPYFKVDFLLNYICLTSSTLPSLDTPYPMLVLTGPQACGKRELAHKLCHEYSEYFGYG